jgi:hypothetical protein
MNPPAETSKLSDTPTYHTTRIQRELLTMAKNLSDSYVATRSIKTQHKAALVEIFVYLNANRHNLPEHEIAELDAEVFFYTSAIYTCKQYAREAETASNRAYSLSRDPKLEDMAACKALVCSAEWVSLVRQLQKAVKRAASL